MCLPPSLTILADDYEAAGIWRMVVQKGFGAVLGVDADLLFYRASSEPALHPNLFYDRCGLQQARTSSAGRFQRPTCDTALAAGREFFTLTRRFQKKRRALTYTLMFFRNDTNSGNGGFNGATDNNFCLECDFGRALDFQRHTVRGNGIVRLPWAISLAGSYIYGSGNYFNAAYAQNPVGLGATRLIPVPGATFGSLVGYDGSVLPRNSFKGEAIHKVDLRLSKDVALPGGIKITGIAELFNVFNRANFGSYNLTLNTVNYGTPVQNLATTYASRASARIQGGSEQGPKPDRLLSVGSRARCAAASRVCRQPLTRQPDRGGERKPGNARTEGSTAPGSRLV